MTEPFPLSLGFDDRAGDLKRAWIIFSGSYQILYFLKRFHTRIADLAVSRR